MTSATLDLGLVGHHIERQDGQGRAMLELTRQLVERGHRVTLYCQGRSDELDGLVSDRHVRSLEGLGPATAVTFFAAASLAVRGGGHDAVCVLGPCALPPHPFAYYAQFSHAGWQATWHTGGLPARKHRIASVLGRTMERIVAARADLVVACHGAVGEEMGIAAHRVVAVPNGIDGEEFRPAGPARRRSARHRWGIPADAWVVAFVGEYNTSRKGVDVLVDAVGAGPADEHLLVAGSGDPQALGARADAAGAGGRVHPVGFADAAEVLAAADVAAVPSRYEPFSIVALEAAASRVPLVLSARAGVADHLRDAALLLDDPEDARQLRRALDGLRADPAAATRLVDRAAAVAEQLGWRRVASEAADAVESVARRRWT